MNIITRILNWSRTWPRSEPQPFFKSLFTPLDKLSWKVYYIKRRLKYFFNPKLKEGINRKTEKLLGVKVVETTDILYGIRPEDCIPKSYINKE